VTSVQGLQVLLDVESNHVNK